MAAPGVPRKNSEKVQVPRESWKKFNRESRCYLHYDIKKTLLRDLAYKAVSFNLVLGLYN